MVGEGVRSLVGVGGAYGSQISITLRVTLS